MPGRQSSGRSILPTVQRKDLNRNTGRGQKRALDAFAIAEKEHPQKIKVQRHRLGHSEGERKRKHREPDHDQAGDDVQGPASKKQRALASGSDSDIGSDSDGNEWRVGIGASEDDSDLDSEAAFGSSDEERFEGFAFGRQSQAKPKRGSQSLYNAGLNDDSESVDDLGNEAVDLATALDMNMETEANEVHERKLARRSGEQHRLLETTYASDSSDVLEVEKNNLDDDSTLDQEEMDGRDFAGLSSLQHFVNSLQSLEHPPRSNKLHSDARHENEIPTEFGLKSSRRLTVNDIMSSITDSQLKSSLRLLGPGIPSTTSRPKDGVPGKLEAPLPKRQQDRLDRSAAYEKSKATLSRWIETVKNNRRAEHLVFPLPDQDPIATENTKQLLPTSRTKPRNELEQSIQDILRQSGLVGADEKETDRAIQAFEELKERKMPIDEVRARRAELRMARELLFREEIRAKRIKKIKSKSYRRVHRKAREKREFQENMALAAAGAEMSDAEHDRNDRRRAEERMGTKHRESKWAKSIRQSGRTHWDEDVRADFQDMAKRDDDLRRKMQGKQVAGSDDEESGSESEAEDSSDLDTTSISKKDLQRVGVVDTPASTGNAPVKGPFSTLLTMDFMQRAETSRKNDNDVALQALQRELDGQDSLSSSDDEAQIGRHRYGGIGEKPMTMSDGINSRGIGREEVFKGKPGQLPNQSINAQEREKCIATDAASRGLRSNTTMTSYNDLASNPWLGTTKLSQKKHDKGPAKGEEILLDLGSAIDETDPGKDSAELRATKSSSQQGRKASVEAPVKAKTKYKVALRNNDDLKDEDEEPVMPMVLRNDDLVRRAFAGDEVLRDFEEDKTEIVDAEGDQFIDDTLPGWGDWTGVGVRKKQKKPRARFVTKVEGIKADRRRDAKLERVIINEKQIKKNNKYLASHLPHPFESRQQYERSLRLPIGPEWTTKETFQDGTKPRVLVKQGIIKPLSRPTT